MLKNARISNNVNVATNGLEALHMLHQERDYNVPKPDLIILDLYLPKKSGREILEEIGGDKNLRNIPIIILSSSTVQEDLDKHKSHVHLFITKPFEWEEYKNVLGSIEEFWIQYSENKKTHISMIKPLQNGLTYP